METILQTLRIPRGLWADLEETVIQQDRQFLTQVARDLGLPPAEVLRRCLGTSGAPTQIPTLWASPHLDVESDLCPWWECHGSNLWRRCPRLRLGPTMPCQVHERCTPCPMALLDSDPRIQAMGWVRPVLWNDVLYWVDPDGLVPPRREDGTLCPDLEFKQIAFRGQMVWAQVKPQAPSERDD